MIYHEVLYVQQYRSQVLLRASDPSQGDYSARWQTWTRSHSSICRISFSGSVAKKAVFSSISIPYIFVKNQLSHILHQNMSKRSRNDCQSKNKNKQKKIGLYPLHDQYTLFLPIYFRLQSANILLKIFSFMFIRDTALQFCFLVMFFLNSDSIKETHTY